MASGIRALFKFKTSNSNTIFIRHATKLRGKPFWAARTLQQRLEVMNYKDPELHYKIDIGFPLDKITRTETFEERIPLLKANRKRQDLEKKARNQELLINLEESRKDWEATTASKHLKRIAEHYGVFEHLFGDAYFYPKINIHIKYRSTDDIDVPVYYGNIIKPFEAQHAPSVCFESDPNDLWCLLLTNPDGHFVEQDKEYVHWFIGNIPGNNINRGETIIQYLQPFPPKGTGYQRLVFILYKQEKKIDFSNYRREGKCLTLNDRTFSTLDFYRNKQDILTPAGLAFFQSDWDNSLKDFFHNTLEMQEPIYEYKFPETYVKSQAYFPKKEAFNLYMDRYRDPKQINKEFLVRKLKNVHPFKPPPVPVPYPVAQRFDGYVPTWRQLEITKSRLRHGRINDIEEQ